MRTTRAASRLAMNAVASLPGSAVAALAFVAPQFIDPRREGAAEPDPGS